MVRTLTGLVLAGVVASGAVMLSQPGTTEVSVARVAVQDKDCDDFSSRADVDAYWGSKGYSATNDPERLDDTGVGDGVPCEGLFGDRMSVKPNPNPDLDEKFTPGRSVSVPK